MDDNEKIVSKIHEIKNSNASHENKENRLHELERQNQDNLFIKTDICPHCKSMTVDVWFKKERFSMKRKTDKNGLSKNHRPPKKNFGTLDENIDESGNINP